MPLVTLILIQGPTSRDLEAEGGVRDSTALWHSGQTDLLAAVELGVWGRGLGCNDALRFKVLLRNMSSVL